MMSNNKRYHLKVYRHKKTPGSKTMNKMIRQRWLTFLVKRKNNHQTILIATLIFLLIRSQSKLRTSNPNPYTKLPPTFADMERKEVKGS